MPSGAYEAPRVSPDARRVAFASTDEREGVVWIYELSGSSAMRRLTTTGRSRFPVWSPDGQRVAFQSNAEQDLGIFVQRADGAGTPERLTKPHDEDAHIPESWSPDGKFLLYAALKQSTATLWTLSLADRKSTPFGDVISSQGYLPGATFSPNSRWVTYMSDDNSARQARIYVQPFPATGPKYELGAGIHPAWTRDGKQILFNPARDRFAAYAVATQPSFSFAPPEAIPRPFADTGPAAAREFDPMPDGNVVAISMTPFAQIQPQINIVLNWYEELKQRVPVK